MRALAIGGFICLSVAAGLLAWLYGGDPQEPGRATSIAESEDVVREFSFRIEQTGNVSIPHGTIFEFTSAQRNVRCAAGFISSSGTYTYFNFNDLEFWCSGSEDYTPLKFSPIERPISDFPSSIISNIDGYLYEHLSRKAYDFERNVWENYDPLDGQDLMGASIYRLLVHNGRKTAVTLGRKGCDGLSFYSSDGYLGTLPASTDFGAVASWKGDIYLNLDQRMVKVHLMEPINDESQECSTLTADIVHEGPDRVYAMMPDPEGLLFGGSLTGEEIGEECALVYRYDGVRVNPYLANLGGGDCENWKISEHYSFLQWEGGGLIGNFPEGRMQYLSLDDDLLREFDALGSVDKLDSQIT